MRYLRSARGGVALISIIAFVGIAIAVMALIATMSIMNGFRTELLSRMLGFNGHAFVQGAVLQESRLAEAVARVKAAPGVVSAMPVTESQALIMGQGPVAGAIVRGVTAEDLKTGLTIVSRNIKQGSLAGFGEGEYGGDVILIGDRMAANMGVRAGELLTIVSPSGSATAFGSTPMRKAYTVGGVFSVGMSEYDQAFIYMPLEQAQLFFGKGGDADAIEVMVQDPDRVAEYLPAIRRAAGQGAVVLDWRDTNAQFWGALQVERAAMRIIMLMIILIAALNIISGLVMLVKNKQADIAILRTMGAGRSAIMRVFLLTGASIGVSAVPVGVGAGVLFCTYIQQIQAFIERVTGASVFDASVYFLPYVPAKIEWSEVAIVSGFTLSVSILVTLWPSWWASRIDPVEALRYE